MTSENLRNVKLRENDNECEGKILFTTRLNDKYDQTINDVEDKIYHGLLAKINRDPTSYKEAMQTDEATQWRKAIESELNSMRENDVWEVVKRPKTMCNGQKANIIDSRWVFKRKIESNNVTKFKARLVIRGFEDRNIYELKETYAPVSRSPLVRAVLAIANKYSLMISQLDVKTAFLNGTIDEEIYMEIPEGTQMNKNEQNDKVCELKRALYGLKISPKRWNERFTEVARKVGLENSNNEPCLFTSRNDEKFLILLLYVDDILIASNDECKLNDVKDSLMSEFKMTDLGEPKEFLGISITRDKEKRMLYLSQKRYVDKILEKFKFNESYPQRTPMVTSQVANRERKLREENYNNEMIRETETSVNMTYREAVGSLLY